MHVWPIKEAKSHLSEVVKRAQAEGPQEITLHGRPVAVLLSREAYARLCGQGPSLLSFMQQSPLAELDIEFERSPDTGREIVL